MFDWPQAVWVEEGDGLAGYSPEYQADDQTGQQWVSWFEGNRRRMFPVAAVLVDEPDRFRFRDDRGAEWQLRELTLARYRKHVREGTIGKPEFGTQAAMLEAMRNEW